MSLRPHIDAVKALFEAVEQAPAVPTLYHATPLWRWEKIKTQGLLPSNLSLPGQPAGIFVTHQVAVAQNYADMGFGEETTVPWVIIEIDGSKLDPTKLVADSGQEMELNMDDLLSLGYSEEQLRAGDFPWWVSLQETGQAIYRDSIPAGSLRLFRTIQY